MDDIIIDKKSRKGTVMMNSRKAMVWKRAICLVIAVSNAHQWVRQHQSYVSAFAPVSTGRFPLSTTTTGSGLFAALPEGYREFGEKAILQAAELCGMKEEAGNRLEIQWKAGTIVVTVYGDVSLASGSDDDGDDEDEDDDDEIPFDNLEAEDENDFEDEIDELFSLTLLARTINRVLDDDGVGLAIAEAHSIEVTTPGVSDELVPGTPQFEAFMGFEVIVEQLDPKKQKVKKIEGRLHEHNDEFTVVNIKGRMKKMKNETILSVRLPKAKKEKGVR